MTTRTEAGAEKSFISTLLPWMIAGALAIVYLLTINHWISFSNMAAVERATGQEWRSGSAAPLFVLVISLFHFLPATWVPVAMNLFALACAFFVLVLLARCVTLLPHDRTEKQREKGRSAFASLSSAWIPTVVAVLICGLQLTFWENATTLSLGSFDLLLFAYVVRCLMEYRVDKRESWLFRAAVIYAAAATDSWIFVALSPFFLVSIIWIMGLGFFQLRFISRLFLCFLLGLLLYLYLPLLVVRSGGNFWEILKQNPAAEFYMVRGVFRYLPHFVQFYLVLTSILPIFVISIRWKASFGDVSRAGVLVATWVLHLAHFALLVVCVWAEFDTAFGLRDAAGKFPFLSQARDTFLPLYFLSALSIGYITGYFLLVFKPLVRHGRPITSSQQFLSALSRGVIYAVLVLAPIGLIYKNLPAIRYTNGPMLRNYASAMAEKLPPQAVVLSDDPASLMLTRSWLARSGKDQNYLFFDTQSLKSLGYYRFQTRLHPEEWPQVFTNITRGDYAIPNLKLAQLIRVIAEKHPIYYLHPTFGYYLDVFYPVPHGLVNELRPYTTNMFTPPPLSDADFAENEAFWKQHEAELSSVLSGITEPPPRQKRSLRERWMQTMQIPFEKNSIAQFLAIMYSRSLNTWGVAAQRLGHPEFATAHFDKAIQLEPGNVVASANLEFNKKLRKGERFAAGNAADLQERFGNFDNWDDILNRSGLFDDPTGCLAQGIVFHRGHLERQAAQNFMRSIDLAPDGLLAKLWLARVDVVVHQPEKSLALIDELKARSTSLAAAAIYPSDILQVELAANYVSDSRDKVDHLVKSTLSQKPPDLLLVDTVVQVSSLYRDYTNALLGVDKQLESSPDNVVSLINKGFLEIQITNYDAAISPLNKAISLSPTNATAIFCRAASYLEIGKLDEAQHDYELLKQIKPTGYPAYHGLAEVALRRKDTNTAILNFQLDLTNTPPGSPEARYAEDRLKELTKKPSP
jgi:tetratricopeptide (TPR) repeat protein